MLACSKLWEKNSEITPACRYQNVNKTHKMVKTNLQEEYQKYHKSSCVW
jgi:hypothetical protein